MKIPPLFESSATLIGTVIGAGILGLPYVIGQTGFWLGVILLVVIGLAILARHLMLAEVVLRTVNIHQTPGYAGIYLGKWAKYLESFLAAAGSYGALLAYIVGIGEVLQAILGGTKTFWSLSFFIIGALFILAGLNLIKRSETIMSGFIFLITLAIGFFAWNDVTFAHLQTWQPQNFILPYGVILFAYAGASAIPQMRQELEGREKLLLKSIIAGSFLIFLIYFLFTFLVLGVTGAETTEIASIGLGQKIGPQMILIGNLLAFFTISTSFLTLGLSIKEMYQFDFRLPHLPAWLLTIAVPILLFFIGARDFIKITGLVGAVLGGCSGILGVLYFWQARVKGQRQPEFVLGPMKLTGSLLIIMFIIGAVFSLINI